MASAQTGTNGQIEHRNLFNLQESEVELSSAHEGLERLRWAQEGDHYRLQLLSAEGGGLVNAAAPVFFRPQEIWLADVTRDGEPDVVL
ncbi:hypothetical protein MXD63_42715, partial [Frankia sp. Cpl3]|nr:hypothetical protein [Frankia sp. Cpl3]